MRWVQSAMIAALAFACVLPAGVLAQDDFDALLDDLSDITGEEAAAGAEEEAR